MSQKIRRLIQLFKFGKKDAEQISQMLDVNLSKSAVFKDIRKCYFKYGIRSLTYKKAKVWQLSPEQREELGKKCQLKEAWQEDFYANHRFLKKWSSFKYETSPKLQLKRNEAYRNRYDIGKNCFIGHDVLFERHHDLWGTLKIGNNCLLAKHVYIEYSGEVIIGDYVTMAAGVIIESHSHTTDGFYTNKLTPKRVVIEDRVVIGSNTMILETCGKIGRGARIGAGSVIRCDIPPYAVVTGNPAKVVGFVFSPSVMEEYEEEIYPPEKRTPIEEFEVYYDKYYLKKLSTIKDYISL